MADAKDPAAAFVAAQRAGRLLAGLDSSADLASAVDAVTAQLAAHPARVAPALPVLMPSPALDGAELEAPLARALARLIRAVCDVAPELSPAAQLRALKVACKCGRLLEADDDGENRSDLGALAAVGRGLELATAAADAALDDDRSPALSVARLWCKLAWLLLPPRLPEPVGPLVRDAARCLGALRPVLARGAAGLPGRSRRQLAFGSSGGPLAAATVALCVRAASLACLAAEAGADAGALLADAWEGLAGFLARGRAFAPELEAEWLAEAACAAAALDDAALCELGVGLLALRRTAAASRALSAELAGRIEAATAPERVWLAVYGQVGCEWESRHGPRLHRPAAPRPAVWRLRHHLHRRPHGALRGQGIAPGAGRLP